MPELPEVETIKRSLLSEVVGDVVTESYIYYDGMLQNLSKEQFVQRITGKIIVDVQRRGKYLLIYLSEKTSNDDNLCLDKSQLVMIIHLRMTGRLIITEGLKENAEIYDDYRFVTENNSEKLKHLRAVFVFESGSALEFHDQRKFGTIALLNTGEEHNWKGLGKLGPEPLSCDFTQADLSRKLGRTSKSIKACLLDQQIVAGVGNIYADETLFRAKIHPAKPGSQLTNEEINTLYNNLCEILQLGIEYRGTTFSDYRDSYGNKGNFQDLLSVYNRCHEKCHVCGDIIEKDKIANRGTYYCPGCQGNGNNSE